MNPMFLEQLRWSLEQSNRALEQAVTGMATITVEWLDEEEAGGRWTWTHVANREICLRRDLVERWLAEQDTDEAMLRIWGLNLHELGRVLFSPTRAAFREAAGLPGYDPDTDDDEDTKAVLWAYGVLEDQRVARLLLEFYPEAAPALIAADAVLWTDYTGQTPEHQATLLLGRMHVPPEMRAAAQAAYVAVHGQPAYDWLESVVTDYLSLRSPEDLEDMADLAWKLSYGWGDDQPMTLEESAALIDRHYAEAMAEATTPQERNLAAYLLTL